MFNRLLIILSVAFLSQSWAPPKKGLFPENDTVMYYNGTDAEPVEARVGYIYDCGEKLGKTIAKTVNRNCEILAPDRRQIELHLARLEGAKLQREEMEKEKEMEKKKKEMEMKKKEMEMKKEAA